MSAPYVLMALMVLALISGWWIGNKLAGARVEGLKGKIDNLKSYIELQDGRLNSAADSEKNVRGALD